MQRKNARALIVLVVLILTLLVTASAGAVEVRSGETVIVPEGNVKGPLFISGNNITINADVNGDIFAVGQLITINGRVDGDIIAGANTLKVDGVVLGDIRAAAIFMEINGQVEGSVTGAAQTIELGKVTVGREVMLFGSEVDVSGTILGDALGSANQYSINGPVNGNVRIWDVGELVIGPSAVVGGNVTYRSANQARIDPAAQTGAVTRLTPQVKKTEQPQEGIPWIGFLIFYIMGVVVWGAFYLLFPRLLPQPGSSITYAPLPAMGWGFLSLLLTPLAVLVLMITVIGIPIALILLLAYIIIISLAKIIVADYASRYMLGRYQWQGRGSFIGAFLAAFFVLIALGKLPVAGLFITLIVVSIALGTVILSISRFRSQMQ